MKVNITLVVILLFGLDLGAQSLNQYKNQISKYLSEEDHYGAYMTIQEALKFETQTDSFQFLAGMSAWHLNAYSRAAKHFKSIISLPISERHPEIDFYLGESLFMQGFYSEALIYFKSCLASTSPESEWHAKSGKRIASAQWAKENVKKKNPLIQSKRLDDQINTAENEFSPFISDSVLYITSGNVFEKTKKGGVPRNSGKIMKYNENTLQLSEAEPGLNEEGVHMAHPCLSPDGQVLFFTVCEYLEGKSVLSCDLYYKRKSTAGWGPKVRLPDPVNRANSSSTQPSAAIDPESKLLKLYFSSNRPGGKGGFDLYAVLLNDELEPSQAENLDTLNTEEDEYTPFFNEGKQTLYFSSNGHPGFGGQDIYQYAFKGKKALQIVNLGPSVNSSYDDLYYVEDDAARKAYMVSNKPGSSFVEQDIQACCYDIYKVKYIPASIDLQVNTFDRYDSSRLNNVRIEVRDITETDSILYTGQRENQSNYTYTITEDRKYMVIGSKSNWVSDTVYCQTKDLENFDAITRDLYLVEYKTLNALTFERTTNVNLKGVTVELWDMDNQTLLKTATNPDSNFFDFQLLKGKHYKLMAKKNKYESASVEIQPVETALEPVLTRKLFLELTAIADLRRLLPIRLYFENDMPDPRSDADTTLVGFLDIYNDYYNRKNTYIKEFTTGLRGTAKNAAMLEIDTFFEQNVKANAEKLKLFMDKLIIILEEGHEIDIFLKGYASPRAKSDYNQKLSSRRVSSVRNEFNRYNQESFRSYIERKNFKIKEIPFGESLSSGDVSDSLEDTRNSVYSLKAAAERRVEILEILKGVEE